MYAHAFLPNRPSLRCWRTAAVVAALVFLVGCAALPAGKDLPPLEDWDTRQQVLGGLQDWRFKGRVAVKAGDEGFNGKINWVQIDIDENAEDLDHLITPEERYKVAITRQ